MLAKYTKVVLFKYTGANVTGFYTPNLSSS